nr:hypothetical protein LSAT_5X162741 [Tanacetum cinerariifolium]
MVSFILGSVDETDPVETRMKICDGCEYIIVAAVVAVIALSAVATVSAQAMAPAPAPTGTGLSLSASGVMIGTSLLLSTVALFRN